MCFDAIGKDVMDLNEVIPYKDGSGMTKEFALADADQIQVMGDDQKYSYYFLSNGKWGKGGKNYEPTLDGKWIKTAGEACEAPLKSGQAFWYISRTAKTTPHQITIAGQVLLADVDAKECINTYSLHSNPYAAPVKLNGGLVTTAATKEFALADADQIQVMGDDQKYKYYFLSNGKWGKGGKNYEPTLDGKWIKTAGEACDDEIPAGAAFWYISRDTSNTVKVLNPIAE